MEKTAEIKLHEAAGLRPAALGNSHACDGVQRTPRGNACGFKRQ